MWYINAILFGVLIGFLIGYFAAANKIKEKAKYFKKGYAYRMPIGNELYVVMKEEDYNNLVNED